MHHHKAKAKVAVAKAKPLRPPAKPALASAAPVTENSDSSAALLIIVFCVLLGFVGVALSQVPASALPFSMRIRLDRSRDMIMLVGLAIGLIGAFVWLLTVVGG